MTWTYSLNELDKTLTKDFELQISFSLTEIFQLVAHASLNLSFFALIKHWRRQRITQVGGVA